jgi:hypothetical protein
MIIAVLAQQGTFGVFASTYCCAIPLGLALVLGVVYFGVRYFANRRPR